MIVCLCLGVSDKQVKALAEQGVDYRELIARCQAGTNCGSCRQDVKKIYEQNCARACANASNKAAKVS